MKNKIKTIKKHFGLKEVVYLNCSTQSDTTEYSAINQLTVEKFG